jgi:quinol monooxygenase YgiN
VSELIVSVDSSEIREGSREEVMTLFKELVDFVDANEPRPLAYSVYLNETGTLVTVFQIHPDSASLETHMEVAASLFAGFKDLLTLRAIDIYGAPSERLLGMLRNKARMLGNATLAVHSLHEGLTRFTPP